MSQKEWDRIQAAGAWRRLPPLKPKRRPTPKAGHDFVEAALRCVRHGAPRIDIAPVNLADIPPEKLAAPTLGAVRTVADVTDWCDEARIAFAVELTLEAQRRIIMERLDSILEFLCVGATPDQAMTRIERLAAEYRGMAA